MFSGGELGGGDAGTEDVLEGSPGWCGSGFSGYSMLWQAESGLRFKMAGGYLVPPEAPDPYKPDPAYPTLPASECPA